MRQRFLTLPVLLIAGSATSGFSQPGSLIQQEVDSAVEQSLWNLGPLRLAPSLQVNGGYDSNGLSSAQFPEDDFRLRFAPGLRAVSPIRNRALLEIAEEVNFVYYRKLEELRDIFPVTRLGGAFGGKKAVVRLGGEFRTEKTRPTSEFDIPSQQRSHSFDASLRMALGWRHELTLSYRDSRIRLLDTEADLDEATLQSRLDRSEDDVRLRLTRHITGKTSGVLEGFYQMLEFDDKAAERDAKAYGAVAGFVFNPKSNVQGQALLGYERILPEVASQADYSGLIGSVDTSMGLGQRLGLQVMFSRDAVPSVFENNWFFIENRFGGSLEIRLMERFSVQPGVVVGKNTYPRPENLSGESGAAVGIQVKDEFKTYNLSFNYQVTQTWMISLITSYLQRESNFRPFTKDRLTLSFGLSGGMI